MAARLTLSPQEPVGQDAALQELVKLLFHKVWQTTAMLMFQLLAEAQEILLDELVKKRLFRPAPFIACFRGNELWVDKGHALLCKALPVMVGRSTGFSRS